MLYRANPYLTIDRFDDGTAIVVDAETHSTHIFNETALLIFEVSDGKSQNEIYEKYIQRLLEENFEVFNGHEINPVIKKDFDSIFLYMIRSNLLIDR